MEHFPSYKSRRISRRSFGIPRSKSGVEDCSERCAAFPLDCPLEDEHRSLKASRLATKRKGSVSTVLVNIH